MDDLLAARSQMAMSLAFHIIFAVVGMAMPLLMIIAEARWMKTGKRLYRELAERWAKGTAIIFAVGAVSGTVLSFELGLLWPTFMEHAGPLVGMPFSLEGFAFFLEAIFLGVYLYGWDRVGPKVHWFSGLMVLISGTMSGIFVVTANAWMNTPVGFEFVDGKFVDIRPWEAMFNPMWFGQCFHMVVAAFQAVAFAVAGIHAAMLLRDRHNPFHRKALTIALAIAAIASVAQPIMGDVLAKDTAEHQPTKLAAMEGQFETEEGAPLRIGGWPDEEDEETRWAVEIPYALSYLAHRDFDATVEGLEEVPRDEWPPVPIVHIAFQIMIFCGFWMLGVALLGAFMSWRRGELFDERWYLWLLVGSAPLGFIAIEAGWTVTEVGRQPWVIQGYMRTADAVTPMPGLVVPFTVFTILYLILSAIVVYLLWRHVFQSPSGEELAELVDDGAQSDDPAAGDDNSEEA
ncbi:MAG: cytochrome ubiquinol oxidase subunit I [Persicimonas sp.]